MIFPGEADMTSKERKDPASAANRVGKSLFFWSFLNTNTKTKSVVSRTIWMEAPVSEKPPAINANRNHKIISAQLVLIRTNKRRIVMPAASKNKIGDMG